MTGKLIFVSGLSGAGKTTFVGSTIANIKNLEVLLTYTTRPMRPGEEDSYEYVFVSETEYTVLQASSDNWDETTYNGFKYASNAEKYIRDLAKGINVIVSVTPSMDDIGAMESIYGQKAITIWIDVERTVASSRVSKDKNRSHRLENDKVKEQFQIIFKPNGSLEKAKNDFVELVRNIINGR